MSTLAMSQPRGDGRVEGKEQADSDWKTERILGSGSFGTVTLYSNQRTNQLVAVKKCRLATEMTNKHRERWKLEVDIMNRLIHENVVRAAEVPPFLQPEPGEPAVLGMEYCSGGDLRRLLTMPENACGLKERDVKKVCKDVAAGIQYLHGKRIIHRDLKPENIVLQPRGTAVVYKIIDLGYAKQLDQGSLCTSFAGTVQYLAPELLAQVRYTCTVDHWSFGTLVYECITGTRPFLPSLNPFQCLDFVKRKRDEHICAYYQLTGEPVFDESIPQPHYLCRVTKKYFEEFLRMMLKWDGGTRGGGFDSNKRATCFSRLSEILQIKVIHVFCVPQFSLLTYPLSSLDKEGLQSLLRAIETETEINVNNQLLIRATGECVENDGSASQVWAETLDENIVFLFNKSLGGSREPEMRAIPSTVLYIMREPDTILSYPDQKIAWAHAMFFCNEVALDIKYLEAAQKAALNNLIRKNSDLTRLRNALSSEIIHLKASIELAKTSLDYDLRSYKEQLDNGGIACNQLECLWEPASEELVQLRDLEDQWKKLSNEAKGLHKKIIELQQSQFATGKYPTPLVPIADKAVALYAELKKTRKEDRKRKTDNKPMVNLTAECIRSRDMIKTDFLRHLEQVVRRRQEVDALLPMFQKLVENIADGKERVRNSQLSRQKEVWSLLSVSAQQRTLVSNGGDGESNRPLFTSRQSSHSSLLLISQHLDKNLTDSMMAINIGESTRTELRSMPSVPETEENSIAVIQEDLDWSFLDS